MTRYYIGYSINDNYFFSLSIAVDDKRVLVDNRIVDHIVLSSNRMTLSIGGYLYKGKISSKIIDGNVFQIHGRKKRRYGSFYCKNVDKGSYLFYHQFNNPFLWFLKLNGIKSFAPIYKSLSTSTGFQFSLMSFNVCSSFTWTSVAGINSVSKLIAKANSDIVCLQEIDPLLVSKLQSIIYRRFGISYYSVPKCCILSKFNPIREYKRTPLSPVYGIKISHAGIKIRIFNSHLTDRGFDDPQLSKEMQYPQLKIGLYDLYSSRNNSDLPTILAGDHNTISHLDDKRGWKVSTRLQNDGWIDTYRKVHPHINMKDDYSYPNCRTNKLIHTNETGDEYCPPKLSHPKNSRSYRIDYIYSKDGETTGLLPIGSVIIDKFGKRFPSDHNALITTFTVLQ